MKSTGSIATYFIFEFFVPACFTDTSTCAYCIVHRPTVYENALLFSLEC